MCTTCLFCMRPLGAHEVLEQFPVGRCVAFDAEEGRLWVVCPTASGGATPQRKIGEIGAIADSLLLPEWVPDAMKRLRSTRA